MTPTPSDVTDILSSQLWLMRPATQQLSQVLGEQEVRFVGGCVRDSLLGRPVQDVDCATQHLPDEVMRRLEAQNIRCIPTGLAHGTVTAIIEDHSYEITTLRRDVACDGRHAQVAFTDDWTQDAQRRDFTMNALYCDVRGQLYDFTGGIADAKAGRVRFIGDAQARIEEDALRILRFFRFYATHGRGAPDVQALAACHAKAAMLEGLSAERIQHEMRKLFAAAQPPPALEAMQPYDILARAAPGAVVATQALACLLVLEKAGARIDGWLRLALCLRKGGGDAALLARRWKCSSRDTHYLHILCNTAALARHNTAPNIAAAVYQHGQIAAANLWLRDVAERGDVSAQVMEVYHQLLVQEVPVFPVQGADLIARGWQEGKALGQALQQLEQCWQESDFSLSKDALLARLSSVK